MYTGCFAALPINYNHINIRKKKGQTDRGKDIRPMLYTFQHNNTCGCDASAQTYTELLSVGTDARALPVPWLSPPDVPTQDLATAMVDIIAARPDVPPDVVSQELCARFPGHSLSQNRTLQLAVDFSIDLSAQMAQRLLDRMAHHFGHLTHVEPSAIVAFLADQLGEWKRRPSLIRHGAARNLYRPRH